MTTIAYCGKYLASDTQAQSSYIRVGETQKIFKKNGKIYAGCGNYSSIKSFVEKKTELGEDDVVFEIDPNTGKCIEHCKAGWYLSIPPVSIGSGCEIAMGAMMAGADAKKAVSIAIKLDTCSGGKVKSVKVK